MEAPARAKPGIEQLMRRAAIQRRTPMASAMGPKKRRMMKVPEMPMRVLTCIANPVSEMSEMRALVSDDIYYEMKLW